MTVKDLYERMSERLPESLREEWDNDGLMCAPDGTREVCRVLLALDVTEELVDYANIEGAAVVVGCGDYAEIWAEATYEEMKQNLDVAEMLAELEELGL